MLRQSTHPTFWLLLLSLCIAPSVSQAASEAYCGHEGVWLQILGAGGPEINDGQGGPSYLVWHDNKARLLVDTGAGASVQFDKSNANFADLEAIVFTHLHADHTSDFPALIKGSAWAERTEPLKVLGPTGAGAFPDTSEFVERLIGKNGAYPYLASFLTSQSASGYKLSVIDVPATGNRRWARFGSNNLKLAAIPVNHGPVPALAWRAEIGGQSIVFSGDFNNQKNVLPKFANKADALVLHHAIPESARGAARELHAIPSQLGRIAGQAEPRMLILGHRMTRTRGVESLSRAAIEQNYNGPLIFANDMECWGL